MENVKKEVKETKPVEEMSEAEIKEINDSPSKKIVEVKDTDGNTKKIVKERVLG